MAQLIGSGANQVPVNGMLGTAAFVDKEQLPVSEPQQVALNLKANLASPALTDTPTAPTAAVGTNTTQLATTAFVNAEIANDAPTKTGGGASGTWPISVTGNADTTYWVRPNTSLAYGNSGFQYFNASGISGNSPGANGAPGADWYHFFRGNHANTAGYYADIALGLNDSSMWYRRITGGASYGWYRVLDSSNYNTYSPTLTGGNASGTWPIAISGNAATASSAAILTTARTINGVSFNGSANIEVGDLRGSNYISGGAEKPNNSVFGAGKFRYQMLNSNNLGAGTVGYWNDVLWVSSYTGGDVKGSNALIMSKDQDWIGFARQAYDSATWGTVRTILHSGNYATYSPTLTGGGASGTWPISISGRASQLDGSVQSIRTTLAGATGNDYSNSALEVRGDGGNLVPAIGFHQPGKYAGVLQQQGDGYFAFLNQELSAYKSLRVAELSASGNVTAYSDIRLKTDLIKIPDALNKVTSLNGYTYTRTDTGVRQTGVIAQELIEVLPEAVSTAGEHMSVAYGNMAGLLIEAIKELNEKVSALTARVAELEAR